jgi:hypothetical protein
MTSVVTISAPAPHIAHQTPDLPVSRRHPDAVDLVTAVTPQTNHQLTRPWSDTKVATATDYSAATLKEILTELAELDIDQSLATRMINARDWLAEIARERTTLLALARTTCTRLGLHRTGRCPTCYPPPARHGDQ